MDVYDRDELIKAVFLPGCTTGTNGTGSPPSAMRMYVRKDESGAIDVVLNEIPRHNDGQLDWLTSNRAVIYAILRQTFSFCCRRQRSLDDDVGAEDNSSFRAASSAIADESGSGANNNNYNGGHLGSTRGFEGQQRHDEPTYRHLLLYSEGGRVCVNVAPGTIVCHFGKQTMLVSFLAASDRIMVDGDASPLAPTTRLPVQIL